MSNVNDTPLAELLSTRSNITVKEIAWLAGLLEGEGCFGQALSNARGQRYLSPLVALNMTDRDIVEKARRLMRSSRIIVRKPTRANHKPIYRTYLNGANAIAVMMTVLPFMGERRAERIKACIAHWKTSHSFRDPHRRTHCKHGHLLSPDNIYVCPNGGRHCHICRLHRAHAALARNKLQRLNARTHALPIT